MKPTESLPLKEWYELAEEMAATAGQMIKIGKEIESLPEDFPPGYMNDICYYMRSSINNDTGCTTLRILRDLIDDGKRIDDTEDCIKDIEEEAEKHHYIAKNLRFYLSRIKRLPKGQLRTRCTHELKYMYSTTEEPDMETVKYAEKNLEAMLNETVKPS